ncbi:MAG TPA: proton-conducting transporter membrane subunit, partial [Pyrinomonadaceae bacterium]|nr:proton-conducting transporter membrane subunit [Pyrinomonadaceae bacterium]
LMFLGSGSVIHGMHHEQDMRKMGGLKKYMPITYMTFLAGWLAICGIIPFSGFWSKDEILWNAASTTAIPFGWLVWLIGTIAATCTAFYMTRLMAMTFWGKERFREHAHSMEHEGHAQKKEHPTPRHDVHVPHESPKSMWVPLVVLAILATIGGFVGISTAFTGGKEVGGRMNIVTWLNPVIWNAETKSFGKLEEQKPAEIPATYPPLSALGKNAAEPSGFVLSESVESRLGSETATEWLFIVISLVVAGFGIGLGLLFYVKSPQLADIWAARVKPLYEASYNKYWIDEFYGLAITRRTMDLARLVFGFDSKVVDGGVNGSAWLTRLTSIITGLTDKYFVDGLVNTIANFVIRLMSPIVRAAQTGLTANYALVMVIGLLVAVALYFIKSS